MTLMSLQGLTVRRDNCPVVDDVSVQITAGECVGLIGPNGAGKTTLLRGALGLLPHEGHSSLTEMTPLDRARHAAWMPQSREIAWPIEVETLIALGRIPHLPRGAKLRPDDQTAIDAAISRLALESYRTRTATQLSGGEQARVLIARALAQDTPLLMADEPIAGLDPANQISTMQVFQRLAQEGHGVVISLHDLGLAARHCTRLLMMHQGRLIADGPPREVLTPDHIAQVFGITGFWAETETGPVFQPMEVTG